MAIETKTSFFGSVIAGIKGAFKGLLAGGFTGATLGAIGGAAAAAAMIGSTYGAALLVPAGTALFSYAGLTGLGWGAGLGATALGSTFATIGVAAGIMTGVVKSREQGMVRAEDAMEAVKVATMQGMAIEQQRNAFVEQQMAQSATHWQDTLAKKGGIPTPKQLN